MVWTLRIFLVFFILIFLVYYMSDDVQIWCREKYGTFKNLPDILPGYNIEIPPDKRQPNVSIKEFYKDRESRKRKELIETRLKFKAQPFVGSVMTDGFHADLPEGTKWKGGTIVGGQEVQQEMKQLEEYSRYMDKKEAEHMKKENGQISS